MENVWVLAAVWVGLAPIATLVAIWFKISTALSEAMADDPMLVSLSHAREIIHIRRTITRAG